jgi:hypothetical protein
MTVQATALRLHGSLSSNLQAAVTSAERLRSSRIYPETLSFWSQLLDYASNEKDKVPPSELGRVDYLIDRLEAEVSMLAAFQDDGEAEASRREQLAVDRRGSLRQD